jgi:hypothetical protein
VTVPNWTAYAAHGVRREARRKRGAASLKLAVCLKIDLEAVLRGIQGEF